MASRTVAAHLDGQSVERLRAVAQTENRAPSQIVGVALKAVLDLSPGARRALFAIDGIAGEAERAFAARAVGRAALQAYERILDGRRRADYHPGGNAALDSEEAIEAEAVRMCPS